MSFCYSRVIRNCAIVMFLVPIMPAAIFYFILMTCIFYWVNKYILVRRSNKLISYSTKICVVLVDELELCLAMFVLGCATRDFSYDYIFLMPIRIRALHVGMMVTIVLMHWLNIKQYILLLLPLPVFPVVGYDDLIRQDPNSYYLSNPAYDKTELTQGRRRRRLDDTNRLGNNQISVYVIPQQDLYEIEGREDSAVNGDSAVNTQQRIDEFDREDVVVSPPQNIENKEDRDDSSGLWDENRHE